MCAARCPKKAIDMIAAPATAGKSGMAKAAVTAGA